jgi:hypothetical protein
MAPIGRSPLCATCFCPLHPQGRYACEIGLDTINATGLLTLKRRHGIALDTCPSLGIVWYGGIPAA